MVVSFVWGCGSSSIRFRAQYTGTLNMLCECNKIETPTSDVYLATVLGIPSCSLYTRNWQREVPVLGFHGALRHPYIRHCKMNPQQYTCGQRPLMGIPQGSQVSQARTKQRPLPRKQQKQRGRIKHKVECCSGVQDRWIGNQYGLAMQTSKTHCCHFISACMPDWLKNIS